MMELFFIITGVLLLLLMLPVFFRVVAGPTAIDRIVGINMLGTKTTVLLVFIGTIIQRGEHGHSQIHMFVDFALAYALLNFIGSLVVSRYFHKTRNRHAGTGNAPEGTET
jgi:multicomponent Na+:H+ antiporter subunit F